MRKPNFFNYIIFQAIKRYTFLHITVSKILLVFIMIITKKKKKTVQLVTYISNSRTVNRKRTLLPGGYRHPSRDIVPIANTAVIDGTVRLP